MTAMRSMPDNHSDLAIVDPPYGIDCHHKMKDGTIYMGNDFTFPAIKYPAFDNTKPPDKEYFQELFRVSKNQIIWGANHFIESFNKNSSHWIVWDKNNSTTNFADCELAWTSFEGPTRKIRFTWNGFRQENMKNKERRIHPTQKPVGLYKWLLQNYTNPGNTILDTHLGSGSLAIACWDMGYDLDAYEILKVFADRAKARLADQQQKQTLFGRKELYSVCT